MSKKAALHNLGCKVNAYETEAMKELLREDGYEIVDFHDKADVYVVNTCTVTSVADQKSRQTLHRAKKENPDAIVVAAGCYVQTAADKLRKDNYIDILIGNNKKDQLVNKIHEYIKGQEREASIMDVNKGKISYEALRVNSTGKNTRAFVKIQDGCNEFCTYCLIPYARGRNRFRDIASIKEEVKKFAKNGYKEVVLTGIHLSAFGENEDFGLIDVIESISEVSGIERIRLGSIEPRIITEDFARRVSKIKKFCPHFHLSLQSGCNKILKRMNRKYTKEEFREGCILLRKYFKDPALTTDVIVGFPGETEEDFMESYEFYKDINFYEMHVFKFSKRRGTGAYTMPNQVTNDEKTRRSHILLSLAKKNGREYREKLIGTEVEVLIECKEFINKKFYWTGFTKTYVRVIVDSKEDLKDRIVSGKAIELLNDELIVLDRNLKINIE